MQMNDRERLIELLRTASHELTSRCVGDCGDCAEKITDYLLEHGIIVSPFKIGQKVWYISTPRRKENIFSAKVLFVTYTGTGFILSLRMNGNWRFEMDEDDVYATREEAEKALKGE